MTAYWKRLRGYAQGPRRGALFTALATLALLLLVWQQAGTWYRAQLLKEQRSATAEEMSLLGNALSSVINRRFARLQGLEAFVLTELQTSEVSGEPPVRTTSPAWPGFEIFAAALYADTQGIRNLAVAPGGVVRYVYPLAGNESVLGYEPLKDPRPDVRADVERAIASRQIVLSSPNELVQGGLGLIARQAIYQEGAYWGLINMVLDLPALLEEAGLDASSGDLDLALRDNDGRVFYGSRDVLTDDPVIKRIKLQEGTWELAAVPSAGWPATVRGPLRVFQIAGLIIAGLLTGLTYLSINRQAHLASVVRQRTHELQQSYELLERRVEQRTRELATLLELSNKLASTLELTPLLQLILEQLRQVVNYTGASVFILEGDQLRNASYRGPAPQDAIAQLHFSWEQLGEFWADLLKQEPLIVGDVRGETPQAQAFRRVVGAHLDQHFDYVRAWMGIPLMVQEHVLGWLSIEHHQPDAYTPRHVTLALAIANQAAIAIENARLYEQARRLAVLEERQRIARELHDSVSQALYGIGLGARTARALLDHTPSQAVEPLEYVLSLADAGLAEMRALIFELRPDSLEKEGLVAALTKQAASLRARHNLEVQAEFCQEPALPFEVKEALYRIAQEALNNTVKHARASAVEIRLDDCEGQITLAVRDDGVGFDPGAEYPGHLGLHSMRERAARLGGALEIESEAGHGTLIRVRIPPSGERK